MFDVPPQNPASADETLQEVIAQVAQSGVLPAGVDAKDAVSTVLCTLALCLDQEAALEFARLLPPSVQALVQPCTMELEEHSRAVDSDDFLHRLDQYLGITAEKALEIVHTVFAALQERMYAQDIEKVEGALPFDLNDLWRLRQPRPRT